MTIRQQFDTALRDWRDATARLDEAIVAFMNDGVETRNGTWILTMSQIRGQALHAARQRADAAKAVLDAFIDDLQLPQGSHPSQRFPAYDITILASRK